MNMQATAPKDTLLPWRDPSFRADPYPWYDRLRAEAPVYLDPLTGGYIVSRYRDVVQYGKHPALTMKAPEGTPKGPWSWFKDSVITIDPPAHTALRRKANKWFTPKATAEYAKQSAAEVHRIIDDLGPEGVTEAYENLALIPGHYAMCTALGVGREGYRTGAAYMRDCMIALGSDVSAEEQERAYTAFRFLRDRVSHHLAEARRNPQPGMLASWIEQTAAGDMTETQLYEGLFLFWATATPNAAYVTTGGLELFARQPEYFELWKSRPEMRAVILAELVRLHTAEMSFDRFVAEDLEIEGVAIPKGAHIRFLVASANRDTEVFEDPHAFRIDRPEGTPAHLSFGVGAHICPGQAIALAQATAILDAVAERATALELAGDPVYGHDDRSARYLRLPLRVIR
ncbi:cytochrome P450 [Poseidonocella sp. HB161398]|uniref:cytochrome P450 n=1 Tax=Poseidonocella sp. HB161398 TaxID=2320855 RepID=UPI0014871F2B|nr:cytochrome P450 [Poseidonocella sp. HB161398]